MKKDLIYLNRDYNRFTWLGPIEGDCRKLGYKSVLMKKGKKYYI